MMTDREKFEAWFAAVQKPAMAEVGIKPAEQKLCHDVALMAWQAAQASQQPADDGWIEWAGGHRPLDPDKLVELKFRDGEEYTKTKAHIWDWSHDSKDSDDHIIAYRVVKP